MNEPVHCIIEFDPAQAKFIGRVVGFPHFELLGSSVADVEAKLRESIAEMIKSDALVLETQFAALLTIDEHLRRNEATMRSIVAPPAVPVGKIKTFGAFGPKYEVGCAVRQLDDGDWMIEVMMVESGTKAEYRLTNMADDPDAP